MPDWHYKEEYREVIWRCHYCSASPTPIAESTRLSYEGMDAFGIPASFEIENEQTGMGTFSICKFAVRHNYATEFAYVSFQRAKNVLFFFVGELRF